MCTRWAVSEALTDVAYERVTLQEIVSVLRSDSLQDEEIFRRLRQLLGQFPKGGLKSEVEQILRPYRLMDLVSLDWCELADRLAVLIPEPQPA